MDEWLTRPGGLASRLHALRAQADLTIDGLVARLGKGWTRSKVSKIANGKQLPTVAELTAWAKACGADDDSIAALEMLLEEALSMHRELRVRMRLGQAPIQRSYDELARSATLIRNAETVMIPGLLQTPGYVRARMLENVRLYGADPAEVDAAVTARLERQRILYDDTKRFEFVITEACLRLVNCERHVMAAQLDRLLNLVDGAISNLVLGIIPFGVELEFTPQGSFMLFDNTLAAVETLIGDSLHYDSEAASYASAMDNLLSQAWTGDRARRLVLHAIEGLKAGNPLTVG